MKLTRQEIREFNRILRNSLFSSDVADIEHIRDFLRQDGAPSFRKLWTNGFCLVLADVFYSKLQDVQLIAVIDEVGHAHHIGIAVDVYVVDGNGIVTRNEWQKRWLQPDYLLEELTPSDACNNGLLRDLRTSAALHKHLKMAVKWLDHMLCSC